MRDADTHLLMLLAREVRGGHGGKEGENGRGGSGGRGGAGGSSYSWTESESSTDSEGKSQTRSTRHSNWGVSSGTSGRDGRSALASLSDGANGRVGTFAIEVQDEVARVTRYPSRYDVRLVSFKHRDENGRSPRGSGAGAEALIAESLRRTTSFAPVSGPSETR